MNIFQNFIQELNKDMKASDESSQPNINHEDQQEAKEIVNPIYEYTSLFLIKLIRFES